MAKTIVSPIHQVNLVEVYSSQGCSSCPPAEKWLEQFKSHEQLFKKFIPINFHVDYWDHIGWKDPYAQRQFTQRQRRYSNLNYIHNIATPGFVVNGKGWNGWFRGKSLPIDNQKQVGKLSANIDDGLIKIQFSPENETAIKMQVHVAILGFDQITHVKRGENRGRDLSHDFVVIGYKREKLGREEGQLSAKMLLPTTNEHTSEKQAIVVWVSESNNPQPIQVAGDWL